MVVQDITVVDLDSLDLTEDIKEYIGDFYDAYNDSYHRYYPDENWTYMPESIKEKINEELKTCGVKFPEVMYRDVKHPDGYFNYYILFHINW